jgi:hypothetical protein
LRRRLRIVGGRAEAADDRFGDQGIGVFWNIRKCLQLLVIFQKSTKFPIFRIVASQAFRKCRIRSSTLPGHHKRPHSNSDDICEKVWLVVAFSEKVPGFVTIRIENQMCPSISEGFAGCIPDDSQHSEDLRAENTN